MKNLHKLEMALQSGVGQAASCIRIEVGEIAAFEEGAEFANARMRLQRAEHGNA